MKTACLELKLGYGDDCPVCGTGFLTVSLTYSTKKATNNGTISIRLGHTIATCRKKSCEAVLCALCGKSEKIATDEGGNLFCTDCDLFCSLTKD